MGGNGGYLRFPSIRGDDVVFVCEDDLWTVPASGGRAYRLTAGVAAAAYPRLSPDGRLLAFVGREEGPAEVYVMPATGGAARRLTFHGTSCTITGWDPDGRIVYASDVRRPFRGYQWLYAIDPSGSGIPAELLYGPASSATYGPGGAVVMEAMAVGLPVVGFANGELASVVRTGEAGYVDTSLSRVIDAAERLIADPAEARRLGDGARRVARERYDIRRFARDWSDVLLEVAA